MRKTIIALVIYVALLGSGIALAQNSPIGFSNPGGSGGASLPINLTSGVTDVLPVANGGTGLVSGGTFNAPLVGDGLGGFESSVVTLPSAIGTGTTYRASGSNAIAVTPYTIPATVAEGDILYASSSGAIVVLPKGAALSTLRMNAGATAPEWF